MARSFSPPHCPAEGGCPQKQARLGLKVRKPSGKQARLGLKVRKLSNRNENIVGEFEETLNKQRRAKPWSKASKPSHNRRAPT